MTKREVKISPSSFIFPKLWGTLLLYSPPIPVLCCQGKYFSLLHLKSRPGSLSRLPIWHSPCFSSRQQSNLPDLYILYDLGKMCLIRINSFENILKKFRNWTSFFALKRFLSCTAIINSCIVINLYVALKFN